MSPPMDDPAVASWLLDVLRSRDRRALGVSEVEARCKELTAANDEAAAQSATQLARLLVLHISAFSEGGAEGLRIRLGAIAATASAVIGLGADSGPAVLPIVLPPLMLCLTDPDRRVGVGACEAVYNIGRVVRADLVPYAPRIIEALYSLATEKIGDVVQCVCVLDMLLMDLVCEARSADLAAIVHVLITGLKSSHARSVCHCLDWVGALESNPSIGQELLEGYPELIKVLFDLVVEEEAVRALSLNVLSEFLERTKQSIAQKEGRFDYEKLLLVITQQCRCPNPLRWEVSVEWLDALLSIGKDELLPFTSELLDMLLRLLAHTTGRKELLRIDAVAQNALLGLREMAVNDLRQGKGTGSIVELDLKRIMSVIVSGVEGMCTVTRHLCMHWLLVVLPLRPHCLQTHTNLFTSLLRAIDDRDDVASMSLEIIGHLFTTRADEPARREMMHGLLRVLQQNPSLLHTRFRLVVEMLCEAVGAEDTYVQLCEILAEDEDIVFVERFVSKLAVITTLSPKLHSLRAKLPCLDCNDSSHSVGFLRLLMRAWMHNAVSAITLSLLSQEYGLASELVRLTSERIQRRHSAGQHAANAHVYPQLDQLAGFLDQPVFAPTRVHLLEPEAYPHLCVCLSSLLELLPQSAAAVRLRRVVKSVPTDVFVCVNRLVGEQKNRARKRTRGLWGVFGAGGGEMGGEGGRRRSNLDEGQVASLLSEFEEIQEKHDTLSQGRVGGVGKGGQLGLVSTPATTLPALSPLEVLKQLCSEDEGQLRKATGTILLMCLNGEEVRHSLTREGCLPLLVNLVTLHTLPPPPALSKNIGEEEPANKTSLEIAYLASSSLLQLCQGKGAGDVFARTLFLQAGGLSVLQDVLCAPFDAAVVGLAGGGGGIVDGELQGNVERVDVWMVCLECLMALVKEGACDATAVSTPALLQALRAARDPTSSNLIRSFSQSFRLPSVTGAIASNFSVEAQRVSAMATECLDLLNAL